LPQRRSGDHWTLDGDLSSNFSNAMPPEPEPGGPIPRQRPEVPEARAAEAPPAPAAPPSWPPVSPAPTQAHEHDVADRRQPPSDRTAEIPRVRLDWEPTDGDGGYGGVESNKRFVDETMELPIFRELESAWFQTRRPGFDESPAPGAPAQGSTVTNGGPVQPQPSYGGYGGNGAPAEVVYEEPPPAAYMPAEPVTPVESPRVSADRSTAGPAVSWHTAADEGWQAAAALAENHDFATTDTGLPKRVPMSQLVPGGIDKNPASAHRRTPESVRGLLSAYHRGVQRGRTRSDDPKTPEPTTAGPQNSQAGKEQEA
jgi:hypothetical protein